MASSVFYKFKSQRDESRVTFDGTGISVFDLKKEIILVNNLGKANDFDLFVYDRSSNEGKYLFLIIIFARLTRQAEYKDDSQIVPRSTSVIVKRMPSVRPGKGKAAMYIAGTGATVSEPVSKPGGGIANVGPTWHKGAMSKRFDGKDDTANAPKPLTVRGCWSCTWSLSVDTLAIQSDGSKSIVTKDDEQAAMAAMFQAQTANWEETQEKMSQFVSRFSAFIILRSRSISHERDFCFSLPIPPCVESTVPSVFILILEELDFLAVEQPNLMWAMANITNLIAHYHQVMCATDVDKKVSFRTDFLNLSSCINTNPKGIGYTTAPPTTIESLTTSPE